MPSHGRPHASLSPESQLATLLAGTAERRAAAHRRIVSLADDVDLRSLTRMLAGVRLLPLLGGRLVRLAPERVDDEFRHAVKLTTEHVRRRSALVEHLTLLALAALHESGVPALPLKGPLLADRIYEDSGLRSSTDIDLLVSPERFHDAVGVLEQVGWEPPGEAPWDDDGLPLFEATLRGRGSWRPAIDLHWRVHWYERDFSAALLKRSLDERPGVRVARPHHELATLLLYWCRDGFWGLRHAADIAAWWDALGHQLEPHALDAVVSAHPALERALATAADVAEEVVGLPAASILSKRASPRRLSWARRIGNPAATGQAEAFRASTMLMDCVVAPPRGAAALIRRYLLVPPAVVAEVYGLGPEERLRRRLRRPYYAAAAFLDFARGAYLAARPPG